MEADVISILRGFASGEIPPKVFHDQFCSIDGFEQVLGNDPNLGQANYARGGVYLYLLDCDFDDPGGILDAHGAVCDFLDRNGHTYRRTGEYSDFYSLVLDASPEWATADAKYVAERIMPEAGGRTGLELRLWLEEQILEKYRYLLKPPEWNQDAYWPHGSAGPMVFLGQIEVNGYFHDARTVYVFHDPATGNCETIIQCF